MKKIFLAISLVYVLPVTVSAHSFGQLYNLPVPFWLYLYGGVAVMVVSFLLIGYFSSKKKEAFSYSNFDLSKFKFFNYLTSKWVLSTLKVFSLLFFILTILSGLLGENLSYLNFNMTFFWVIFVLGLSYLTVLVGNVYSFINPWKILTDLIVGKNEEPLLKYPKSFGYYPALIFYFVFIWIELVGQTTPFKLSVILLVYTIINDLGVVAFGRGVWFKYCEFFSVFFRLLGKMAPVEYKSGRLYLRNPFVGLLKEPAENFSLFLFTLFMLSSTAFDGFKETLPWSRFYWGYIDDYIRPIFKTSSYYVFETLGILLMLIVFLLIYLLFIKITKIIAKSDIPLKNLALEFAFSLIPIAFVYNVAHYYTLVFTEGPNIINLLSDPFGFGWNLFGVANTSKSIILGANFIWHSQVAFILVGHIVSIYLSHVISLKIFPNKKQAFWSGFPTLLLMIVYTMIGLWILSQPLTGGTL